MSANKRIIIRVTGGVGNQLYIYAFAKFLQNKYGFRVLLETKTGFMRDSYHRSYRLSGFTISLQTCNLYHSLFYPLNKRVSPWIIKIFYPKSLYITEYELESIDHISLKIFHTLYLDGLWQNSIYSQNQVLQVDLGFKDAMKYKSSYGLLYKQISSSTSVAVHVRRVQYSNLLPQIYYEEAMKYLANKFSDPVFFIFSDDMEWCRTNLSGNYSLIWVTESQNDDELADLFLMSLCQHFIIANSSFSWWGATIASNRDKIVLHPSHKYFKSQVGFFPETWLSI